MQPHTSHAHVPAHFRIDFSQSIDRSRPRTLLTQDSKRSGSLQYRYTDTGETTTVPNIWYNQTIETAIARLRWQADKHDERVQGLIEDPPIWSSKEAVRHDIRLHRAKAKSTRQAAAKLDREQEGFFFGVSDYFAASN